MKFLFTIILGVFCLHARGEFPTQPQGTGFTPGSSLTEFNSAVDSIQEGARQNGISKQLNRAREKDINKFKMPFHKGRLVEFRKGITRTTISKKLRRLQPNWDACYNKLPKRKRKRGKVNLFFQIGTKGKIQNERVQISRSTITGPSSFLDCVLKPLKKLTFEKNPWVTTVETYPLVF